MGGLFATPKPPKQDYVPPTSPAPAPIIQQQTQQELAGAADKAASDARKRAQQAAAGGTIATSPRGILDENQSWPFTTWGGKKLTGE